METLKNKNNFAVSICSHLIKSRMKLKLFGIAAGVAACMSAHAQDVYFNGSQNVHLKGDVELSIHGDLEIIDNIVTSGVVGTDTPKVHFFGSNMLVNPTNGVVSGSAGDQAIFYFQGTSAQTLDGGVTGVAAAADYDAELPNMVIDNANGVTLNNTGAGVKHNIRFGNGTVKLESNEFSVGQAGTPGSLSN